MNANLQRSFFFLPRRPTHTHTAARDAHSARAEDADPVLGVDGTTHYFLFSESVAIRDVGEVLVCLGLGCCCDGVVIPVVVCVCASVSGVLFWLSSVCV